MGPCPSLASNGLRVFKPGHSLFKGFNCLSKFQYRCLDLIFICCKFSSKVRNVVVHHSLLPFRYFKLGRSHRLHRSDRWAERPRLALSGCIRQSAM
jgi:hypothetical protein